MCEIKSLTKYVSQFVHQLVQSGVEEVIISPGSRSTPLAMLFHSHPEINVYVHVDERSAGFFGLGIAKAKQKPVAILCTSGTASANYMPAIVEANLSRVPLIILTADRPHELRGVGAPQAIDQTHLYREHVKYFVDMAIPEDTKKLLTYAKTMASRAALESMKQPKGPVHLNFPFREPLTPNLSEDLWEECEQPIETSLGMSIIENFDAFEKELSATEKGLIVCGELHHPNFKEAILSLAEKTGFPILADPLSNLRYGNHDKTLIIDQYDTLLKDEQMKETLKPELVLRFGSMPVSKSIFQWFEKHADIKQWVIDAAGGWRDATLQAVKHIQCDEAYFCYTLANRLENIHLTDWTKRWLEANRISWEIMKLTPDDLPMFEGHLYTQLPQILPNESSLFISNSMPIRDVDTFLSKCDKEFTCYANRGANGIDGIISSGLGISKVHKHVYLIIGDLSFYHDMNGLLAAKLYNLSITIILVNNNGGGIFSFLPQSKEKEHFETLFGTATDLDFSFAATMYGANYHRVTEWTQLKVALTNPTGFTVVEVMTDRHQRAERHRSLIGKVSEEIKKAWMN
ncbi:2-succinyl-5-enolpyruvyl-6-hydroxy-3-cyclohexene-1-carboxylic-acid synthase [Bacillus carboniphilus]|uniref:2-succinyl-5-enolpyruvyl-6-hydroxy-3-cyclohexene-1-carboxylate synthase n=1 Tax=Bacillus carboniphilus TaxID=86663 RepID=A0ABY9JP62_9BACI|nr:2-succinyl-5-enolpyruvyl-6-hydroxy-3-cyclohexene-1-carboxylic-acid synthase [Bacillus carboniphilus]WLR41200.1 2-succinyl-5-enolpyruvyl-6-hydroxy-3-cyclohexene-1-carboxylic-acid synthase [Bacillus carboniphilus]